MILGLTTSDSIILWQTIATFCAVVAALVVAGYQAKRARGDQRTARLRERQAASRRREMDLLIRLLLVIEADAKGTMGYRSSEGRALVTALSPGGVLQEWYVDHRKHEAKLNEVGPAVFVRMREQITTQLSHLAKLELADED